MNPAPQPVNAECRLLRLPDVMQRVNLGKTTIYALVKRDEFPAPVKAGRTSLWRSDSIERWIEGLQNGL